MDILFHLISRSPPHRVLVHVALVVIGMRPAELLAQFAKRQLHEFRSYLEEACRASPRLAKYVPWLELLPNDQMGRRFDEFLHDPDEPAKQLQREVREMETIILISKTLAGLPGAFEELIAHEKWISGHVAPRLDGPSAVPSVVNDAWLRIYKVLRTFDPAKARFRRFALIWITYAIQDHYRNGGDSPPQAPAFPSPDSGPPRLPGHHEGLLNALKKVYNGGSPPHELVVFALGSLLQWFPNEVWTQLASQPLATLVPDLERDLVEKLQWRPEYVAELLLKVRQSVQGGLTVAEALENEKTRWYYSEKCPDLLPRFVGESWLLMYCSPGADEHQFSDEFTNWTSNVMKRLRREFLNENRDE